MCEVCGNPLPQNAKSNRRFCDKDCQDMWYRWAVKRDVKICSVCGKEFMGVSAGLCCSSECYAISRHKANKEKQKRYSAKQHTHYEPCHTPGCPHKTPNYYCKECRRKRKKRDAGGR